MKNKIEQTIELLEYAKSPVPLTEAEEADRVEFLKECLRYVGQAGNPELAMMYALNARLARIERRLNGEGFN